MRKYKRGETIYVASGSQYSLPNERIVETVKRDGTYRVKDTDPTNLHRWIVKPMFIIPTKEEFEIECEVVLARIEEHKKMHPEYYDESIVPFPTIDRERYYRMNGDPMIPETQHNSKWGK